MAQAREYPTRQIRNVVVLGHAGAGKTSLVGALCYAAGNSRRRDQLESGQALTMTTPEEVAHGVSMQLTPAYAEWLDTKINLLDTPGYLDFTGEALAAVQVADAAVIVLGATSGVEVGTEKVWEYCEARGIPRILFVSGMDRENADFDAVYEEVKSRLTPKVLPVEIPVGSGDSFRAIVNLFSEKTHVYRAPDGRGEYDPAEIPPELESKFTEWETELQETLATTDERLLEEYLEGGRISREEAIEAIARGMARGEIVPLFCGSSRHGYGIRALLRKMVELFPSPAEAGPVRAERPGINQETELAPDDGESFSALVFKTTSEAHVGGLSYFRVYSGSARNGSEVVNAGRGAAERLNHLSIAQGKERTPVSVLHAGDIGVVGKLRDTHTNDTLSSSERPVILPGTRFPRPDISLAIEGEGRSDEDKLGEVLVSLREEDPTFHFEFNPELHQTLIRGLGELHLEVQVERMRRRWGVKVRTGQPRIAYRETIEGSAEAQGRYKKQSGGRGQFGDCRIRIEPLPRGSGYEFVDAIKGGVIPGKYIPSVDRGIQDAAQRGILAGFPMVDFRIECYDGSYHSVDSSDIAFQVAGSMAFQKAARAAGPILLEPIMQVEVVTPTEMMGDILADITQRRGKVLGMDPSGGRTVVRARVPQSELYKYAAALRALSQGRAHHTRSFSGYEPAPESVAKRVIEETAGKA